MVHSADSGLRRIVEVPRRDRVEVCFVAWVTSSWAPQMFEIKLRTERPSSRFQHGGHGVRVQEGLPEGDRAAQPYLCPTVDNDGRLRLQLRTARHGKCTLLIVHFLQVLQTNLHIFFILIFVTLCRWDCSTWLPAKSFPSGSFKALTVLSSSSPLTTTSIKRVAEDYCFNFLHLYLERKPINFRSCLVDSLLESGLKASRSPTPR